MNPKEFSSYFRLPKLKVVAVFLAIYVIFFEFMIPNHTIIPKPSMLIMSFGDLYQNYPLKSAFIDTFVIVILSFTAAFIIFRFIAPLIIMIFVELPAIRYTNVFFVYTPNIFFMIVFIFWFDSSYLGEFLYLVVLFIVLSSSTVLKSMDNFKIEYAHYAKSLKISRWELSKKVIMKGTSDNLKNEAFDGFSLLWLYAIIYEYIAGGFGIGNLLRLMKEFGDYYGVIVAAILTSIIIFISRQIFSFVIYKTTFWK